MKKIKVVVLSGAGISVASGLTTFRDNNGLWEKYKVEEVASIDALKNNTQIFLDFYNMRKNQLKTVEPNSAHHIVKEMEDNFEVTVVTQNVDNLHERAGSNTVYHLHGELSKIKSSENENYVTDYIEDLKIGDVCPEGHQLRPHVVLFGENLPTTQYIKSLEAIYDADVVVIIGTSLRVHPAADLPWRSKENTLIYYIDPADMELYIPKLRRPFFYHIQSKASEGIQHVYDDLKTIFL